MEQVPLPIIKEIASYLIFKDLQHLILTCKRYYELRLDHTLWRKFSFWGNKIPLEITYLNIIDTVILSHKLEPTYSNNQRSCGARFFQTMNLRFPQRGTSGESYFIDNGKYEYVVHSPDYRVGKEKPQPITFRESGTWSCFNLEDKNQQLFLKEILKIKRLYNNYYEDDENELTLTGLVMLLIDERERSSLWQLEEYNGKLDIQFPEC